MSTNYRETMANGNDLVLWGQGGDQLAREFAAQLERAQEGVREIQAEPAGGGVTVWFDTPDTGDCQNRRAHFPEGWTIEWMDHFGDGSVAITVVPEVDRA